MIASWAGLKTEVVRFVANNKVQDVVETCIQLAEARIRNDILIKRIEKAVHGAFDGAAIFLPEDCEAIERLMFYVGQQERSVPYSDPRSVERFTVTVGDPVAYTMLDQAIVLYPTPSAGRAYSLYYIPSVPALGIDLASNWLLERAPNVYLHAACLEGAIYLHDIELSGVFEGRYKQALDALQMASERQRMPSATAMASRPFRAMAGCRT